MSRGRRRVTTSSKDPKERRVILNAFRPGLAIVSPRGFAGRKDEIATLTDTIRQDGLCPTIFGERGLGKSSVANQIQRIAEGDVELLQDLGLDDRVLCEEEQFVTFALECTDDITSKDSLLQRLINQGRGVCLSDAPDPLERESETSTSTLNLRFYKDQVKTTYTRPDDFVALSVEEKLLACVQKVTEKENRKVLLLLDELDRVKSHKGLASFIKSASSVDLKFMLVGIAHDLSSLLEDHQSLGRTLVPVEIKRMGRSELGKIVDLAQEKLSSEGIEIVFEESARESLVTHAAGLPWFVHVLGTQSLQNVYDTNEMVVTSSDVNMAVETLATSTYARQLEDRYKLAVGSSWDREVILRLFAKWNDRDIPTSELYPMAKKLGVSNPSVQVKELQLARRGRVLSRAPFEEKGGIYSFRDAIFKRFVDLRGSWYSELKVRVEETWGRAVTP